MPCMNVNKDTKLNFLYISFLHAYCLGKNNSETMYDNEVKQIG